MIIFLKSNHKLLSKAAFFIALLCFKQFAFGQVIINGDFENNTAGSCQFNLLNGSFTSMMSNTNAFGSGNQLDIQDVGCGYGSPAHGNWFISLANYQSGGSSDALSLSLSTPFIGGQTYTISYYQKADLTYAPSGSSVADSLYFGVSNSNSSFGTFIFASLPAVGAWNQITFSFTAPFTANYLTLIDAQHTYTWTFVDDIVLDSSNAGTNIYQTTCANLPYNFHGNQLSTTGIYSDTLLSYLNTDSVIILHLNVNPINRDTINSSICSNQTYTLPNGQIVNTAGTYTDTLINHLGCDSIITTILSLHPVAHITNSATICSNSFYTLPNGQIVNTAGTYTDTIVNHYGCDSIITTILITHPISQISHSATICSNSTYTLPHGQIVNIGGIYNDTFTNYLGCDSIIKTTLNVIVNNQQTIQAVICNNQTYTLPNGQVVNTSGIYRDTFTNHLGCDSIIITKLKVNAIKFKTVSAKLCSGHIYTLPDGKQVTLPGTYLDTISTYLGCDSIITTYLVLQPNSSSIVHASFCVNKNYTLPDGIVTAIAGTYTSIIANHNGCDSTITTILTIKQISFSSQLISICGNQTYTLPNGQQTNITGIYTDTIVAFNGCDSIVYTDLRVHPFSSVTYNQTICNNQTYTLPTGVKTNKAGTYVDSMKTIYGCDSIIITHLQVATLPQVNLGNDTVLCSGNAIVLSATNTNGTYLWNDWSNQPTKTVSASGMYSIEVQNPPCPTINDSIQITYVDCENCGIVFPSAFTPNSGGQNSFFKVNTNCLLVDFSLKIYNRWGQKVFETTNVNDVWDGKFNNTLQEIGVFVYFATVTKLNGEQKNFHGNLTLIR